MGIARLPEAVLEAVDNGQIEVYQATELTGAPKRVANCLGMDLPCPNQRHHVRGRHPIRRITDIRCRAATQLLAERLEWPANHQPDLVHV